MKRFIPFLQGLVVGAVLSGVLIGIDLWNTRKSIEKYNRRPVSECLTTRSA